MTKLKDFIPFTNQGKITKKDLQYSTGNSILYGDLNGKEIQKRGNHVCVQLIHFAVQ